MNAYAHYVHWGWVQISYANLTVIILMILVFVLAVLLPFPNRSGHTVFLIEDDGDSADPS